MKCSRGGGSPAHRAVRRQRTAFHSNALSFWESLRRSRRVRQTSLCVRETPLYDSPLGLSESEISLSDRQTQLYDSQPFTQAGQPTNRQCSGGGRSAAHWAVRRQRTAFRSNALS
ncbi:MAG TPA: hypothetical protein VK945_07225 [Planococcus sp. (in: firmicutes)]|nr:hypothetical protein [Planococcus sp. (in: firmicutes)]